MRWPFILVFAVSFLFHLGVGWPLYSKTLLLLHPSVGVDLFLDFDNAIKQVSVVRHPLLKGFSWLLQFLQLGDRGVLMLCSGWLAGFHTLLVCFCRKLLFLDWADTVLLLLLSLCMACPLLLGFTMESYPLSLLLGMAWLYFLSRRYQEKKPIGTRDLVLWMGLIGGITLTNGVKVILMDYRVQWKKSFLRLGSLVAGGLLVFIAFKSSLVPSLSWMLGFVRPGWHPKEAFYFFFGSPLVFPDLIAQKTVSVLDPVYCLKGTLPNTGFKTLVIAWTLGLLAHQVCVHRHFFIFKAIGLSFLVDIFLHLIIGLGSMEAYLYAGHFAHFYPVILGFGLKRNSFIYRFSLFCLALFLVYLNFSDLSIILDFGLKFYPKQ